MVRKLFTSMAVFLVVFALTSIIADIYYRHRLTPSEQGKERWTCRCDFRVFWTAGYKALNHAFSFPGPKDAVYERELDEYIGRDRSRIYDTSEEFYHFRYAPATAFFMAPFALIAYPIDALAVWFLTLNIALLAALLLLTRQISSDLGVSRGVRYAILWGAAIVSLKFYLMGLSVGQSDVFIALFFVLFLMAYVRGRQVLAGVILALIIQFKPQFVPILLYFLLAGRPKLVVSAVIGSLALLVSPVVVVGPAKTAALLQDWLSVLSLSIPSQILNPKNQSITYAIGKFLLDARVVGSSVPPERLFYALSALLTGSAYLALLRLKKAAADDRMFTYLEVSLLIIITLLFSPIVWVANFISLIIPAGVMVFFLSTSRERAPLYACLACFVTVSVIAGTDITRSIPGIRDMRFVNIAAGTLFLAYALARAYRQGRRAAGEEGRI